MDTSYKVLYRKYRPSNFDEIVGQKYTINMLKTAVSNNKLSHAYIFTGPRGTGKTSTAKIFAKTINCENSKDGIPCGECTICKNINNNADIIEIDAASNNGVDEIRELINNVKIAPSFSKYKVYIIDEVHMMTQSAFNALLLTLEEPPAHVIFILATTNIESVPITILSRCQRYDFKKIDDQDIILHLKSICEKESIEISEDAIQEIAYLSDGGLRDALSILNQLSTSTDSINLETVMKDYGTVSLLQIKNIVKYFLNNDYYELKNVFDNLSDGSIDYKTFLKKLIDELFKVSLDLKISGNQDDYHKVKEVVFELNDLINKINININPFLLIFMIFGEKIDISAKNLKENGKTDKKIIDESKTNVSNEKVLEQIEENNENESDYLDFLDKLTAIRINNCFSEADKLLLNDSKNNWKKFIENVSSQEKIKNLIIDCEVVLASNDINILVNSQNSLVSLFNKEFLEIQEKYKELIAKNMKFVALSTDDWNTQKQIYIKRIKDGYKYSLEEEPEFLINKKCKEIEIVSENVDSTDSIMDIFDKDKIEIK